MPLFNLNLAFMIIVALLLSTITMAQSSASSPTELQSSMNALSPSTTVAQSPASSPTIGSSPPDPSNTSLAISAPPDKE
ncbi:hypothetical protein A2U01_0048716, partial [Trifolium medium]|nr:hypothetical protein [Trifolium medium]